VQHSLQVREVVVLKEEVVRILSNSLQVREVVVVKEVGCQACEQLSPGERVC
jgi:hypothetical protein